MTLSKQLWGIGTTAFADCTSLRKIFLPSTLEVVGNQIFLGNRVMESVHSESDMVYDIDGVLFIKNGGLNGNTNELYFYPPAKKTETYCVPNGTEWVGARSFRQADYVKNIIIPQSVHYIAQAASSAFGGESGIKDGTDSETSTNAVNIIFKHDTPTEYILGSRAPFSYTLPAGSMITVKNEAMKKAAELSVTDEFRENVTVRVAAKASRVLGWLRKKLPCQRGGRNSLNGVRCLQIPRKMYPGKALTNRWQTLTRYRGKSRQKGMESVKSLG